MISKLPPRIAVSFHLYIGPPSYLNNLIFFLKFGLTSQMDVFVSISGVSAVPSVLPRHPNIFYKIVSNKNYDLGGHSENSKEINQRGLYGYVFFINCSVRGPFLPAYFAKEWFDPFLELFDQETGAVASSINLLSPSSSHSFAKLARMQFGEGKVIPHMQSSCFCLNSSTFQKVIKSTLRGTDREMSKDEAISEYEVKLSLDILRMGFRIKCILPEFNVTDFRNGSFGFNFLSINGDVLKRRAYFGRTPHPYELIFVKTNRGLYSREFLSSLLTSARISHADKFPDISFLPEKEIPDFAAWSHSVGRLGKLRYWVRRFTAWISGN